MARRIWNRRYHREQFVAVTNEVDDRATNPELLAANTDMPGSSSSAASSYMGKPKAPVLATGDGGSGGGAGVAVTTSGTNASGPGAPVPVLKPAMTLANLQSSKNLNKVAPENLVVAPPKTRKEKVLAFLENKYVSTFLTLYTIFALFGDDFRVSFMPKSADMAIYNTLFSLFIIFALELGLSTYSRPRYFNRGRGVHLLPGRHLHAVRHS